MLNIVDEFMHECLAIRIDRKLNSTAVIDILSDFGSGFLPESVVTDDLRSYHAAARDLGIAHKHRTGRWRNNRAGESHQPTLRRERKMQGRFLNYREVVYGRARPPFSKFGNRIQPGL